MKVTNPVLGSKVGTELTLRVIVLKIIFFNDTNYYAVCECQDDNGNRFICTGKFPTLLHEGQSYEFKGVVAFQRGANQLSVSSNKNILPFDRNSMISYLATLPNVKSKAIAIYQQYGRDSLNVLKNEPMRVAKEVKGIGKITALRCKEALEMMSMSEEAILKLLEYGLTAVASRKLYDIYGDKIIDLIEANPYFLLKEVKGYGFNKCDAIAEQVGYDMRGSERLSAGIKYTLELAQSDGHCYLPINELINKACEVLSKRLSVQNMVYILKNKLTKYTYNNKSYSIDLEEMDKCYKLETGSRHFGVDYRYKIINISENEIKNVLERMIKDNSLILEEDRVYLRTIYEAERYVEKKIISMCSGNSPMPVSLNKIIDDMETLYSCSLEPEQRAAIKNCLTYEKGIFTITGSAGCGKTFTMKLFAETAKKMKPGIKIKLFAPTGKAAKVLKNATGYDCKTIHRGLEYTPDLGFTKNEFNPIDADIVVVDETSMLDIELMYHFLKAIKPKTKLVFLGDVNQLQSVGCGNVLNDLLKSRIVRNQELLTIKRQSKDSGIIMNANGVITSTMPNKEYNDFIFEILEDEEDIMKQIIDSYMNLINDGVSIEDIQILTPQKNNKFGTYNLNRIIQELVNKRSSLEIPYRTVGDYTLSFKEGDKVIHTKNNYDKEWFEYTPNGYEPIGEFGIFNGDCGIVDSIYLNPVTNKKEMFVRYEDKYIRYIGDDLEEIELAYALTIHKSQGSEWPHVIIPMLKQHYAMLNKHLLYTAITRAIESCTLITQKLAIETAINRSTLKTRYTNLCI